MEKRIKVLVIGDIMIDHYIYGNCSRISPEAPVPIVEVQKEACTLGGAGNVLKNLIALNSEVDVVSVIGDDEYGNMVLDQLLSLGVSGDGIIKDADRCTTVKSRVLVQNHQLIRLDNENAQAISKEIETEIFKIIELKITLFDIVLISDYNKGLLTRNLLNNIFSLCKEEGIRTLVDPKGADFSKYKGVNIIKPNKKEASLATGITIKDNNSLKEACILLKEITCCDEVIVTLSEEGIAAFAEGELILTPTKALDVVDVTGAGDTVIAALSVVLAANKSVQEACDFANHAAAIVVSKSGSAVATIKEIEEKFSK